MSKQQIVVDGQTIDLDVGADGLKVQLGENKATFGPEGLVALQTPDTKVERVEGGMLVTGPNGFQMKMGDDGNYEAITPVKSVGIRNLAEVAEYTVAQDGDVFTHTVKFNDGGHAQVTFKDGRPGEISGRHFGHSINMETAELYLSQYKVPQRG